MKLKNNVNRTNPNPPCGQKSYTGFESEDDLELSSSGQLSSMRLSTDVPKDTSSSSSESLKDLDSTQYCKRRSWRERLRLRLGSLRKRDRMSPEIPDSEPDDHRSISPTTSSVYSVNSSENPNAEPDSYCQLKSVCSSASSVRSHRFKFWSRSTEGVNGSFDELKCESSQSALSDTVVYQHPPRHKVRFWLNGRKHGYSDSILEIRQSAITTRITRSKSLAGIAAAEAARFSESRRKARALKLTAFTAAAAFARLKEAKEDINASHGSIANAAMLGYLSIASATHDSVQDNEDYKKLQGIFQQHFKHRYDPAYFRRLKYTPMKQLDKSSAAYKMHLRLKAIPTPNCKEDTYKFYSSRLDKKPTVKKCPGSSLSLSIS